MPALQDVGSGTVSFDCTSPVINNSGTYHVYYSIEGLDEDWVPSDQNNWSPSFLVSGYAGTIVDGQPRSFVGNVQTDFILSLKNTGGAITDYRIEPKSIPSGWIVDGNSILNNYVQIDDLAPNVTAPATFHVTAPTSDQNVNLVFGLKVNVPTLGWQDLPDTLIPVSSVADRTPPTITNVEVEQDNLGHVTVYATVTDIPYAQGLDPNKVLLYFDDLDDFWPTDYARMDNRGNNQYSFTIPFGVILPAGDFPDGHRLRLFIRAEDYSGNQSQFDISPDPFAGNAYLIVNNGSGQSTRLAVTDPGDDVVSIDFLGTSNSGDAEFRVLNNRFLWLEIIPMLTNGDGSEKIPMPGFLEFSSSLGWVASLGNRSIANGGDLLSAKGIHALQWPPIIPKDQYIDYTVTTQPGDSIDLTIYSKDDGTKWNAVVQVVSPLLRVLGIPMSLSDNALLAKFEEGLVIVQTIMLVADETQSFWDNINRGEYVRALVDTCFCHPEFNG